MPGTLAHRLEPLEDEEVGRVVRVVDRAAPARSCGDGTCRTHPVRLVPLRIYLRHADARRRHACRGCISGRRLGRSKALNSGPRHDVDTIAAAVRPFDNAGRVHARHTLTGLVHLHTRSVSEAWEPGSMGRGYMIGCVVLRHRRTRRESWSPAATLSKTPMKRNEADVTTAVAPAAAALSAADRCDRCGAQAYLRVELQAGGELLFCAHHAREHGDKLREVAANVAGRDAQARRHPRPAPDERH